MGELPSDAVREVLVRARDTTNPNHGCKPAERPLSEHLSLGVINLDKPAGPTSHEVVAWIKLLLDVPKAGHGGTLDPGVTGMSRIIYSRRSWGSSRASSTSARRSAPP